MRSRLSSLTSVGLVLAAGVTVQAQSMHSGSIAGVVRDKSGHPLPETRIQAKSGQTERIGVSNAKGEYRLPLLNVGEWTLTVIRDGFQTSTVKAHVGINETRVANFNLLPVQQAVVEVVGQVGSVDTTTTQVSTNIAAERLAQIPMDMTSLNALDGLMAAMPGVQVASSGAFNVMGGTDDQNLFTVDGTVANKTASNRSGAGSWGASTQPAREFLESVEVVTNAFGAEYGAFGGVVNALTKSGTNSFEGSLFYGTNFPHTQAAAYYNRDWTPAQKKPADPDKYHRYGASVSGPILKDKLFFFVGYQGFKDVIPTTTLLSGGQNWDGLKSDSANATGPNQWTAKLNWFINSENQLIFSGTRSKFTSDTGNSYYDYGTLNRGNRSESTSQSINLTWNWMPTSNLYIVTSVGNFRNPSTAGPISGAANPYSVMDFNYFSEGPGSTSPNRPNGYQYVYYMTGTGDRTSTYEINPNTQYRVDLTWVLGQHQIKAGYLRQQTYWEQSSGAQFTYAISNATIGSAEYLARLNVTANYSKYTGVLQSYYVKDVVELLPSLRLDVGLRYDPFCYEGAFGPYDGMHLAEYNSLRKQLQPRIGLIWDVDRDGRKKVYAHFGRFFMAMPMAGLTWAKTSGMFQDIWFPGSWAYNATYTGGPFTLLKDTPDVTMLLQGGQGKPQPHATDLRLPRKNSWTLGADWSLDHNWSVGGLWTFWELKDVMEDSYFLNDDGTAAFSGMNGTKVIWNPGPGAVTFVDSDGVQHTWNSNFPEPKDRYIGLNLHANHQGERHYLSLDYTWTHHYGNYLGESVNSLMYSQSAQQIGYGQGGTTTDYDYARGIASGNYEGNPVHEFKARGGYRFSLQDQDFNIGLTATWQSGIGLTKAMTAGAKWQANAANSNNFGGLFSDFVSTDNQRCNMGHAPSQMQINADLSANIKVRRMVIRPNFSINNLFNQRAVLGYSVTQYIGSYQSDFSPEPNFGKIYAKQAGRSITAGFSLQF